MKKTRAIIRGNTVYEIDRYTKQPKHIIHGTDRYFKMRNGEDEEEYEEYDDDPVPSPAKKRMNILKLMGNKKKLVSKADGLAKEIAIVDIEPEEEEKKEHYNKYRKLKKSSKPKRKIKKCRCKK